jgi:hypothetical protein
MLFARGAQISRVRYFKGGATLSCLALLLCACSHKLTQEEYVRYVKADFSDISRDLQTYADSHGRFPDSLREMLPRGEHLKVDWLSAGSDCPRHYGYATSENGKVAVLVSVGVDAKPNTSDDLIEIVKVRESAPVNDEEAVIQRLRKSAYASWKCVRDDM